MTERESKKINCVKKYLNKRQELNAILKTSTNDEEIDAARLKLAKLPVNSSPSRVTNRCQQCGRPHAVYRKFELCRICLRNELMNGNVTGGRKSSW